jgi:hypothetical protein
MAEPRVGEMQIGRVLKEARARAGLDMRAVEEQTKIRIKYLRALEGEEWESLPSPAYAKGFLRTYAQLLGLDGEALVDEFRRQVESGRGDPTYPLGDQVLERRRRPGEPQRDRRLGPALAVAAIAVIGVLLVIGLTGGEDGKPGGNHRRADRHAERKQRGHDRRQGSAAGSGTVQVELSISEPVEICLVGGGGEALIDGQVLAPGTEEAYERKRFELRFPSGFDANQFKLKIAGQKRLLPKAKGPAAYKIVAPQRVKPAPAPGPECP